jgi:drug/metabolite transporter (DMT)-like permease
VYVLWYWVLKYWEASRLAVFHNIQPMIATVVAYLWLGETLTPNFIIGGGIVIAGVVISESRWLTKPPAESRQAV